MVIDMHLHTSRYSPDSQIDPGDLIERAIKLKLDGLVLTEHDAVWEEEEIAELKRQSGEDALVILRGQEVSSYREDGSPHGHLLVYGYYQPLVGGLTARRVVEVVHGAGGVVVAAHPYRVKYGLLDDVYGLGLDGLEVLTPNHYMIDVQKAEQAVRVMQICGTGGSDAHDLRSVGRCLTLFDEEITGEEDLIRHIRGRDCRPVRRQEVSAG